MLKDISGNIFLLGSLKELDSDPQVREKQGFFKFFNLFIYLFFVVGLPFFLLLQVVRAHVQKVGTLFSKDGKRYHRHC